MFFNKDSDFISIGELAVDNFIRLEGSGIHTEQHDEVLCLPFATKIPYTSSEEVSAVANAGNAAVAAARLGLRSAIVANVGRDEYGEKCLASLEHDRVSTKFVGVQAGKSTNYHFVLWFEQDRTILQKHSQFSYGLPRIGKPRWIYLTSLGETSLPFHHIISDYLKSHPEVKLAFQPGIFQMKFGTDALKDIYAESDMFCCNVEEAQQILKESSRDLKILMKKMSALGPKTVIITDGFNGAYTYDTASEKYYFMPIYPHTPYERTGAGDAFFSTVVSALAFGKTLPEALTWGPINSMSVVQYVGAQKGLLSQKKLEEYLKKAPSDYVLKEI